MTSSQHTNSNGNLRQGFIKVYRSIQQHWIWEDPIKLKWWLDILLEVNYTDRKVLVGSTLIDCKRGQCIYSLETWAKRWRVDKSKVRRFLYLLQNDNMIVMENVQKTTRITLCKYDSYNEPRNDSEPILKRQRNDSESSMNPTKERQERQQGKEIDNVGLQVVSYLNTKTGKAFRAESKLTLSVINARLNEGRTLEDFKRVIDLKVSQWLQDPTMSKYLSPDTLFGSKFEKYLNEAPVKPMHVVKDPEPKEGDYYSLKEFQEAHDRWAKKQAQ